MASFKAQGFETLMRVALWSARDIFGVTVVEVSSGGVPDIYTEREREVWSILRRDSGVAGLGRLRLLMHRSIFNCGIFDVKGCCKSCKQVLP
jgi:hypothetical protein